MYEKALPLFSEAYRLAPGCICAQYNYANTLHMLDNQSAAHKILLEIITDSPMTKKKCQHLYRPRSFFVDAHFLIFNVMIHGEQGYTQQAFNHAYMHLKLRKIGLHSTWSKKYVENEVKKYEKDWIDGQ